ncbi:MAG: oxygen-independent coproporphyrinogen III oxidase [Bacteroidota bacterium]|nr:oxygen-independent coproporphyrinogen III oxidase [Bacteroidota bacterium]
MAPTSFSSEQLLLKYDLPVPRYTSFPPVPNWNQAQFSVEKWRDEVKISFASANRYDGISVYIHLPFCEKLCTYCGCNKRITVNHRVEEPYIDAVLKEWDMYVQLFGYIPKISELHLGGGTPTFFSAHHLDKLIDGICQKAHVAIDASFSIEVHPNVTNFDQLKVLRQKGFKRLSVGIQDFDPFIQDIINRHQTIEKTQQVFDWARALGYDSINADLVYGLPCQTVQSVKYTFDALRKMKPNRIAFYSYAHVPWISGGQRKFKESDIPSKDEKRKLYETGKSILIGEGYMELGMDHFALEDDALAKAMQNQTLNRNFMGYTTQSSSVLIGLGCSSISDTGNAYAQNEKELEAYQEKVNVGELPIIKGHILDRNEVIIRKHIKNLMCFQKTNWENQSTKFDSLPETLVKLKIMEEDGLVHISNQSLKVTPLGMPFIRNISACFDPYNANDSKEISRFSKSI